jgi:hypothetical protein
VRYLGLAAFTTAIWLLVAFAAVAEKTLLAARSGTKAGGTSILSFFIIGWLAVVLAFIVDILLLSRTPLAGLAFWIVLALHAVLGIAQLAYIPYAVLATRRLLKRKRQ